MDRRKLGGTAECMQARFVPATEDECAFFVPEVGRVAQRRLREMGIRPDGGIAAGV